MDGQQWHDLLDSMPETLRILLVSLQILETLFLFEGKWT